jgi:hypothetical protein
MNFQKNNQPLLGSSIFRIHSMPIVVDRPYSKWDGVTAEKFTPQEIIVESLRRHPHQPDRFILINEDKNYGGNEKGINFPLVPNETMTTTDKYFDSIEEASNEADKLNTQEESRIKSIIEFYTKIREELVEHVKNSKSSTIYIVTEKQ